MYKAAKFCPVLLFLALMAAPADGANVQGLSWGLKSGDRIDYSFVTRSNLSYTAYSVTDRIYVIVNSLPPLPDRATNIQQAMAYNASAYWLNGTPLAPEGIATGFPPTVFVAVGNWPLLTSLMSGPVIPEYQFIDDSTLWGFASNYTIATMYSDMSWTFLKSDGGTYHYSASLRDPTTDTEVYYAEFNRLTQGISTSVLVSVAIISAEIVVAVLLVRRYRH